ncbi:MAG: hypothetical protein QG579_499 [Patescibacteria group bacterium]|jgi:hypothetical protein|nr:hypothetical protein [Patescibacteria group bacterium]
MTSSQFTIPALPKISVPFLENLPVLFIIFVAFFTVYIIVSVILIYHWTQYGTHKGTMIFAETAFILVSAGLFTVAFLALSYY